ncbi:ABC-three component system protein [Lentilitoribacter sp. Alg239-R112]|uniref:ABC-three component system protein n=1 Tax=Lentilitoribacter sp. Alg239-R112 TaxID=2305987 RepID=UPI0013A6C279|nr:ABC-three component system protein [Lentilitoribacter sp. Alg239-R112]
MNQVVPLLQRLSSEINQEQKKSLERFLGDLYLYVQKRDQADDDDLETKLVSANRTMEIKNAEQSLESFVMLLEQYQYFPSGQKLFGFFLGRIHDVFCHQILNRINSLNDSDIDRIIQTEIIDQTITDMGEGFEHFTLTHKHVRGMVYYLADRCFVRWDKKCTA